MRFAIIEGGVVNNVIEVEAENLAELGLFGVESDSAATGWLWDGKTLSAPEPVAVLSPVPESVSPNAMRKALRRAGLEEKIAAYVATLDADAKDDWEYTPSIWRTDPLIEKAAQLLGLSDNEVDDLFRLAGSI